MLRSDLYIVENVEPDASTVEPAENVAAPIVSDAIAQVMSEVEAFLAKGSSVAAAHEEFPMLPRKTISRLARQYQRDVRARKYRGNDPAPSAIYAENRIDPRGVVDRHEAERQRREASKARVAKLLAPVQKELNRRRRDEKKRLADLIVADAPEWRPKASFNELRAQHLRERDADDRLRRELKHQAREYVSPSPFR